MSVDWGRLRAVVLESDDWGLCAWVPDEQAHRALADSPAFQSPAGRIYGRSTLETAADVARLVETLLEFRGGDGYPPVWQANTVMAAPDHERLAPPLFQGDELPLRMFPDTPSRWTRPGLWDEVRRAEAAGVWWPELHGLHHIPGAAWLAALRRGDADARRAHDHQCVVCAAVERSGEYDPSEPETLRTRNLERAVAGFRALFGRVPGSLCPPDYRWDEALEREAARLGLKILQGKAEQAARFLRLRRLLGRGTWPRARGRLFHMPRRIAFEPRGDAGPGNRLGVAATHRRVRAAWARAAPAVVSTHRVNYVHLDASWSAAGRAALRDLLGRLAADQALFLTDAEAHSLVERSSSVRPIGDRGVLTRCYGAEREPLRIPLPAGVTGAVVGGGGGAGMRLEVEDGAAIAHFQSGERLLEWRRA